MVTLPTPPTGDLRPIKGPLLPTYPDDPLPIEIFADYAMAIIVLLALGFGAAWIIGKVVRFLWPG